MNEETVVEKISVDRGYVLAAYLEVDRSDLDESGYRDNEYHVGRNMEYLIMTDEEADEAAGEYIDDSLCYFNADFLESWTNLDADAIRAVQESMYERANAPLKRLIGDDWKKFIEEAVSADGRGHFLSPYDGHEIEIYALDSDIRRAITKMLREEEGLGDDAADPEWEYDFEPEMLFIYRLN